MAYLPMAVYGLEVPAGDVAISARPDIPSAFNITMAALDPSAEAEGAEGAPQRATLKIIRQPLDADDYDDEDDEEDFDPNEMERMLAEESSDDDESEDDEEASGAGPSDPAKSKKARKAAAQEAIKQLLAQDQMDVDEAQTNGNKSAKAKGKMPASDEDDSEDDDSMEGGEVEEFVICTLDPTKTYQQPLNLTIGEDERVWFKVSGTHTIFLTGNYIEPAHDHSHGQDNEDEDDYDLSPDEDELDGEYDSEEDDLDGMEDPRITEIEDEEEAPKLVQASKPTEAKKGKNKRAAEDDAAPSLDAMITESKAEPTANGETKLSKKQLKKMKKNDGTAAVAGAVTEEAPSSNKSDKKVQFAKNLEQGPTPTKADGKKDEKSALGVKVVQGVTCDDKKLGTGPAAKKGDRIGMRYIGKLQKDGKVFDSNKKGKPFTFKLGAGDVIKGWDIGIEGMAVGAERRITLPPHLGYGSRGAAPDIPPNATLVFDVKVIEINKGK